MSAVRGRRPRPAGELTVPIQARVAPELHAKAQETADALKVSLSHYIARLLAHEQATALDENGRPIWWTDPLPTDQEELPLTRSA